MKGTKLEREPLAIIGMACRFPGADSLEAYWANILNGKDCITDLPEGSHWRADDYFHPDPKKPDHTYAKRGGFINPQPFEPLKYGIPPKSLEATDTSQLLGIMVAREALEDAGYGMDREYSREKVSCILGVTGTLELVIPLGARLGHPVWRRALLASGLDEAQTEAIVAKIADGFVPWQEQSFPGLLGNVVAGRIANYLDLGGTNCVSDAACASALSALNMAANELWANKADMVITGGIDTFNDIFMYMCFSKTPALSATGDARPFSAHGDGTILGEGAGIVVLKRLSDAVAAGDKIYATLASVGSSSDGKGNAIYAPNAKGQTRALRRAYKEAGIDPSDIQLIEGHGTGTIVGDGTEINALSEVFSEFKRKDSRCAVGSVKSQIGHTKAAAGAAGLMKAVLAMRHGVLPPSIKVDQPLQSLAGPDAPLYLNTEARPWTRKHAVRRAGVSAFGFGGSNFHCVVEEYPTQEQVFWDGMVQMFPFSAQTRDELKTLLTQFQPGSTSKELTLQAAECIRQFKSDAACRIVLLFEEGKTDLAKISTNAIGMIDKFADKPVWSAPEGIYFGSNNTRGKLGVLFPGQGSQYCNMLRDLACRFPVFQNVLDDVDNAFLKSDGFSESGPLTDIIYPVPAWDEATPKSQEENLRRTEHAQPAIGAVSIGLLKVLNQFGIVPEAAAGHSYGEIPALCASERFDAEALFLLSRLRGQLMAQGQGDRGSMLAVRAPLEDLEVFIREHGLDLVLANKNAPNQIVLSGSTAEIERAQKMLEQTGKRSKRLPVAAAFHSALVAQASQPFFSVLQDIDFPKANIPVYSNTTGKPYPESPEESRSLLANQLSKPVEFIQEIRNMYADGVTTFLEVGPGASLTGLVKSILDGSNFEAIAMDASSGRRLGTYDLARTLAQLATLGYPVKLNLWEDAENRHRPEPTTRKGLVVQISGANYVSDETRALAKKPVPSVIKPVAPAAAVTTQRTEPVAVKPTATLAKTAPVASAPTTTRAPQTVAPLQAQAAPQPAKPIEVSTVTSASQKPAVTYQTPATAPSNLAELLQASQNHISLIQRMQEDTARLHTRFLQGQDSANQTMMALIQQQQQLLQGGIPTFTAPVYNAPAPAVHAAPAPAPVQIAAPVAQPVVVAPAAPAVVAAPTAPAVARPAAVAAPAVKPVVAKAQPVAPAISESILSEALLRIVSEKTGYPIEMLELSMSLDGDLGIDSIKRVEIFSGLSEALPSLPSLESDRVGSLQTLGDILAYVGQKSEGAAPATAAPAAAAASANKGPSRDALHQHLIQIVAEKTGYPVEMLEPSMSLDGDLGIDSIKRVEIFSALQEAIPGLPSVEPDVMGSLTTLNDIVVHLASAEVATVAVVAAPSSGVSLDQVQGWLFEVVSEKTGYPTDMLEPTMSLDGDLGIDSIKRVEILSGLSEKWSQAPEVKPEDAGRFVTLADILNHLKQDLGNVAAPTSAVATAAVAAAPAAASQEVTSAFLSVVADKTGYPTDMLEPTMSLDGDLGIDSIKRVEIFSAIQEKFPALGELKPDKIASFVSISDVTVYLNQTLNAQAPAPLAAPAPAASIPAAPAKPASAVSSDSSELVRSALLRIVAEKTGYPIDMLEWHMGLESDLGIDSIKRVEILSGLADSVPGLPEPKPDEVGSLHTLAEIANWYTGSRSADQTAPANSAAAPAQAEEAEARISRQIPRLTKELLPSTALSLAAKGLVWLAAEPSAWTSALAEQLGAAKLTVEVARVADFLAKTQPKALSGLVIVAPQQPDATYLEEALMLTKASGPALRSQGKTKASLLTCITHLDGMLGFDGSATETLQAGLAGLAKTAHHEWSEVSCKIIDVLIEGDLTVLAKETVAQMLRKGNLELGIKYKQTLTLALHKEELETQDQQPLQPGDVILVSGGARGVTASCAEALASRFRPTLVLLGRSAFPADQEPTWAHGIVTEVALKQAIMAHSGQKHTPKSLQSACQQLLAEREMRAHLNQMRQLGATVVYRSLDMRDASAVAKTVADVRAEFGPIRGIVHGAGVLADRLIEDKTPEQFRMVYSTKVEGMTHLLQATQQDDLKVVVFFSSSTGRFGRTGQVDYAMANEILNKTANQIAKLRPNCRVVSPNWGPWDGGMVTPELKKLFKSEGIDVIPVRGGAYYLAAELCTPCSGPVEIVILGDTSEPEASTAVAPEKITWEQALQVDLSVKSHEFLRSHVLGGKAVLPSVMMIEWSGHAAMLQHPGYQFAGVRNFRVLKGVSLEAESIANLDFQCGSATQQGDELIVPTLLQSREKNRNLRRCSMDVVLTTAAPAHRDAKLSAPSGAWKSDETLYETLFHGSHFQGLEQIIGVDAHGIAATAKTASLADSWMVSPLRRNWLGDPMALDCAFQMMVLWSQNQFGLLSLPVAMDSFQLVGKFPRKPSDIRILAKITQTGKHKVLADLEIQDPKGHLIAYIDGYECVLDGSLKEAYRRRHILEEVAK